MKELIESHLSVVDESPAKNIAKAIGMPDLEVSRELNRMIADGVVERAKRAGGGNEYVYWLTRRRSTVPLEYSIEQSPLPVSSAGIDGDGKISVTQEVLPAPVADPALVELINILGFAAPGPTTVADCLDAARRVMEGMEKLRQNNAALERRLDDALGEGPRPLLLVTLGREAPARRHTSMDSAQRRAAALIRAGKEDSVLVLAPLGKMRRGTEWSPLP